MDLAMRKRVETRRVQQKDDASTDSDEDEEEKSATEAENAKKGKKDLKAAQVKANKEKLVARALRSEAREKRKLETPAATLVPGPPARRGRRWPVKAVAVDETAVTDTAAEEETPETVSGASA
jgi:hypothetical protein